MKELPLVQCGLQEQLAVHSLVFIHFDLHLLLLFGDEQNDELAYQNASRNTHPGYSFSECKLEGERP